MKVNKHTIIVQICDDVGEILLRFFVQVGNGDASRKNSVVWMFGGEVCCSLSRQILRNRHERVCDT